MCEWDIAFLQYEWRCCGLRSGSGGKYGQSVEQNDKGYSREHDEAEQTRIGLEEHLQPDNTEI